jgi:drug/metabolite transporter (DMT)-like permease
MASISPKLRGHLAILAANIIFGINTPLSRGLTPETVSPYTLSFFRMGGALILFWFISFFMPKEKTPLKDIGKLFLAGFFGIFLNQLPFLVGLSHTLPVEASILITLLPVYSMVLAAVILKEPITFTKVFGILAGATGVLLIILRASLGEIGGGNLLGNLLIVASSISYALYLTACKGIISRYSPVTAMKWMFLFAVVLSFPFCGGSLLETDFSAWTGVVWLQIGYVVVFATFVAYFLIPVSQKSLRPTLLSMYNYLQPIIASTIAIAAGMDVFGWEKVAAAGLVFTGVYIVTQSRSRADVLAGHGKN